MGYFVVIFIEELIHALIGGPFFRDDCNAHIFICRGDVVLKEKLFECRVFGEDGVEGL